MIANRLKQLSGTVPDAESPFSEFEEDALVSIAFDLPEYFLTIANLLKPQLFSRYEIQYVMSWVLEYYDKHSQVPSRNFVRNQIERDLTVDHDSTKVMEVLERPANHRDLPGVKEVLHQWARRKTYGMLYDQEAIDCYAQGNYERLEEIIQQANRIVEVGNNGFWFYEQIEELFVPNNRLVYPTAYRKLNRILGGGVSPGETLCWMAATGVGKSIALCNDAIHHTKCGQDTLLITFELSLLRTAMRCLGTLTKIPQNDFMSHQQMAVDIAHKTYATNQAQLCIWELPPDECSVDHIYNVIHTLKRTRGWSPKVVIIDYLELMVGRRQSDNRDDYSRQKHVSNQVRGLAKNEQVAVHTATQTNRAGNDTTTLIDLNKAAESYGKTMSMDYIISLNQTEEQLLAPVPQVTMFVIKNRNGPKHDVIECTINYSTMHMSEVS